LTKVIEILLVNSVDLFTLFALIFG